MPRAPALLGVLHGPLHRPAEGDAVGQLVGDALGDQRGVELGALDLDDVQLHLGVAGDLGEQRAQLVGLGATATDDDARTGGVDVDADLVPCALDLDAADRGPLQRRIIALRIFQSSVRYSLYSRSENQRLFQSVVMPRRNP